MQQQELLALHVLAEREFQSAIVEDLQNTEGRQLDKKRPPLQISRFHLSTKCFDQFQ